MNSVIKGASYVLVHTPDMVLYNGTTQTTERVVNPDSEYLKAVPEHLRSYEEAVSYWPNQTYIGNAHPDELAEIEFPYYDKKKEGAERYGKYGEIMPEEEFLLLVQACDMFEVVRLDKAFVEKYKEAFAKDPVISDDIVEKIHEGVELSEIETLISEDHAEPLYFEHQLVGCVKPAHDIDVNLSSHVMHENLMSKASSVLALLYAVKNAGIEKSDVEYVIDCAEEACGDMNQRGGGNFAKAAAEVAGLVNATGSDARGFCAAPTHALIEAAALVKAGAYKTVVVTAGGCTAKLGPDLLSHVLAKLPKGEKDSNLLVGYDSSDDAAVYRISDDTAIVQTLDFFPPMVDDPYTFGQIAAANALSDIYAMGGTVKSALNIVCFPEKMDLNILGKIMQGGADKVIEAGGTLAGGHSIADSDVKYGLSVMGTVHPKHIYSNSTGQPSDVLILTKKLGVGLVCNANRVGEAPLGAIEDAVSSMTTLNRAASEISHSFEIHACTDVTGFSFLGHLSEMLNDDITALIDSISIPVITGALRCADEFFLTAAAQRNRNHVGDKVCFAKNIPFSMEEVLFDPQTSGGLLFAVKAFEADTFLHELKAAGLPAAKVGRFVKRCDVPIYVN